jgi:hypothetical protein
MSSIGSIGSLGSLGSGTLVNRVQLSQSSSSRSLGSRGMNLARVGAADFLTKLVAAGEAFKSLRDEYSTLVARTGRAKAARVIGTTGIKLDYTAPTVTLSSTEELSTQTTTLDTRSPAYGVVLSTASASIHGTYTGTSDVEWEIKPAEEVSFTVEQDSDYSFEVYIDGTLSSTFTVPGGTAAGDRISMGDGLEISFTEGNVFKNDSITFNTLTGLDLTAQTDVAFNESIDYTLLDSEITSGSFDVNGVTITVSDTDSIDDVIASINASTAGVAAEYNSVTDEVILSTDDGSSIVVENDTSGFLAAMKLDTAVEERIESGEAGQRVEDVSALSGITSGSFEINGITFTVDTNTDSLQDIIDVVNASSAGATMTYSDSFGYLKIQSTVRTDNLTVQNDTTGLFAAFGIEEGVHKPEKGRGIRREVVDDLVDRMQKAASLLNKLSATVVNEGVMGTSVMNARNTLRTAIKNNLSDVDRPVIRTSIGITAYVQEDSALGLLQLGERGSRTLREELQKNPAATLEVLFGSEEEAGLVDAVLRTMDTVQSSLTRQYGSVGILLDIEA